jgi:surfactin synthase thioesterase subunit
VFRSWQDELSEIAVVGVQLPGREDRFLDPPPESFAAAVAEIAAAVTAAVPAGHELVLFGHSLGGLLGYEVARALPATHRPAALVVAAARPPHQSGSAVGSMGDGDSEAVFVELLADKDLDDDVRELIMEVLAQDSELSASYVDPGGAEVPCPLQVWTGVDDTVVTAANAEGWRGYASSFAARQFPGGHDFCLADAEVFTALRALFSRSPQGV